jgi:carbonic anhydrase
VSELPSLPRRGLVVITCMDHRVDPAAALDLELGDAMVIRNAGGRVTPALIENLEILDQVARARGSTLEELELVLMQHTDCGANALTSTDPHSAIRADLAALAEAPSVPGSLTVTGVIYETATGGVEEIERRSPLREPA